MKKLLVIVMVFVLSAFLMTPAFASDVRTGTPTGTSSAQETYNSVQTSVNEITSEIAPNVTTDDVVNRLEHKGNDVIRILQAVGKYVCIGVFIVCCVLAIVGIIGNKRLLAGAILGLIFSGLAYAGIICGRDIVNWIAFWSVS